MIASLLSMRRRLCHHCHCDCHPHDNSIVAIVNVQASLPSSSWRCCPCNNGAVALDPRWRCCHHCNGVITILKLVLLPLLQLRCCHHPSCCPCCLLSSWCCCRQCRGVFAVVPMAIVALVMMALSLLLMHRHVSAIVELALLPLLVVIKLALLPLSQ
jgi:hypothetical protein